MTVDKKDRSNVRRQRAIGRSRYPLQMANPNMGQVVAAAWDDVMRDAPDPFLHSYFSELAKPYVLWQGGRRGGKNAARAMAHEILATARKAASMSTPRHGLRLGDTTVFVAERKNTYDSGDVSIERTIQQVQAGREAPFVVSRDDARVFAQFILTETSRKPGLKRK